MEYQNMTDMQKSIENAAAVHGYCGLGCDRERFDLGSFCRDSGLLDLTSERYFSSAKDEECLSGGVSMMQHTDLQRRLFLMDVSDRKMSPKKAAMIFNRLDQKSQRMLGYMKTLINKIQTQSPSYTGNKSIYPSEQMGFKETYQDIDMGLCPHGFSEEEGCNDPECRMNGL